MAKGVDHEHATVEGVVAAAGAGSAGDGGDGFVSAPVDEVAEESDDAELCSDGIADAVERVGASESEEGSEPAKPAEARYADCAFSVESRRRMCYNERTLNPSNTQIREAA